MSKDGKYVKNYIVSVIKNETGSDKLYINSFADKANTSVKDGVIYSTRNIVLDEADSYEHSIGVANYGDKEIKDISVELVSDTLELSEDTGLLADKRLSPVSDYGSGTSEIVLAKKDGVKDDAEISGKLTIKSEGNTLAVITLNGAVGSPVITTESLPDALKFIPYGAKIENSLTSKNNKVSYSLAKGNLPKGLIVRTNGEIYGIPEETGKFTFTVKLTNSESKLKSDKKEFTLKVNGDTEKRVDNYTSEGYEITKELKDVYVGTDTAKSYQTVSQGDFHNFKNVYLDKKKLIRDKEYTAVEGSTIITIIAETLKNKAEGLHNITLEFRDKNTGELKVAAQKFKIHKGKKVTKKSKKSKKSKKVLAKKDNKLKKNKKNKAKKTDAVAVNDKNKKPIKPEKPVKPVKPVKPEKPVKPVKPIKPVKPVEPIEPEVSTNAAITAETTEYVIKAGDTLWSIAKVKYGNGKEWVKIIEANKGLVPEKLKVGQKIILS